MNIETNQVAFRTFVAPLLNPRIPSDQGSQVFNTGIGEFDYRHERWSLIDVRRHAEQSKWNFGSLQLEHKVSGMIYLARIIFSPSDPQQKYNESFGFDYPWRFSLRASAQEEKNL